ncbi:WD40-repeat-containing domain protein [Zopfochytrium polystomum]|nr:WD40-repeat-containing domain protein [Zopfochytrium polystomum]
MTSLASVAGHLNVEVDGASVSVRTLLEDMRLVAFRFKIPLQESPLQVYFSAVPFSPASSAFHRLFVNKRPSGVPAPQVVRGGWTDWKGGMDAPNGCVKGAAFSPDRSRIAAACSDQRVMVLDASTGSEVQAMVGHAGWVNSAAFSGDGRFLVSGSDDRTVRVWEMATGRAVARLEGHTDWVTAVAFSPDGQLVASGGYDRTMRVWRVSTGKVTHAIKTRSQPLVAIAFSESGEQVKGWDGVSKVVWDLHSGRLAATPEADPRLHAGSVVNSGAGWAESRHFAVRFWMPPEFWGEHLIVSGPLLVAYGAGTFLIVKHSFLGV